MTHAIAWLADLAVTREPEPEDLDAACAAVFDLVTAAVAAGPQPCVQAMQEAYGQGACAIWLTAARGSPAAATFHNALMAARLDLDDGHRAARGHPGAAVIPAVFAEADRLAASGHARDDAAILRAIVAGYEVGLRVASARGFYARTGFWAGLAAATGVASLRRVPQERFAHALAIAAETGPHMATNTAGPAWPQPIGSDVKEGISWGAVQGIAAVSLAEAGLTGALDLVDHAPFFDAQAIVADRGRAAIHEVYTKFYAACRHCHAPIDALLKVMRQNALNARDIEAVHVGAYSGALRIANKPAPHSLIDAQYSIPYCLGLAAAHGADAFLPMTEAHIGDAAAEAFATKVTLGVEPACEARFPAETVVRVTVQARGHSFDSGLTKPKGEASSPISWEDRAGKFQTATRASLPSASRPTWELALRDLRSGRLGPLRRALAALRT
jgi:2-methylcitrate dehydratase PrpD